MKLKAFLQITSGGSALMCAMLATTAYASPQETTSSAKKSPQTTDEQTAEDAAVQADPATVKRDRVIVAGSDSEGSQITNDGNASDIVVVGIRGSIDSALERKRTSKQVVDSVVSEDAGKLPDNNVPAALSRISGVNITRERGQGGAITIRGLQGVQTTINGNDVEVGDGRGVNLADIPAELLKAVDVYKSRGASQPEGGVGGTVNIELRRPLELKKGLLIAGSVRGQYNDVVDKISPYASLLASYRFDTGMGEMGLLLNGSFTRTNYAEALVENESPGRFGGNARDSLPAGVRATAIAPYRIRYGQNDGVREQPALSAAYQWRPSSNLNFILEGQYFGSRSRDRYAGLSLQTREDYLTLSNVVVGQSGALQSATFSNERRDDARNITFGVPTFTFGGDTANRSRTIINNFETHWSGGIAHIDFSLQYQNHKNEDYAVGFSQRYRQATIANVNFNDPIVDGGIPTFTLPGVNLADPAQSQLGSFGDRTRLDRTRNFIGQIDTALDLSQNGFLRRLQVGARYEYRKQALQQGYRNVRFDNFPQPLLGAINIPTALIAPNINGNTPTSFAVLDSKYLFDNFAALRPQILALRPDGFDGDGPRTSIAAFFAGDRPAYDRGQSGNYIENRFAAYGELNWATSLGFPVEGAIGLRYVNLFGNVDGVLFREGVQSDNSARSNTVDLLPSASAVWHFTPKFQMRTAFNINIQRPSFYALRGAYGIDRPTDPNTNVFAGNPGLRPTRDQNFNATLEWYPRAGMSLTAGAFYKRQTGFIYYTARFEPVPPLGGAVRQVFRERNAGPGEILGFEFATTVPFFFLPDFLKGFGVSANATYIPTATLAVPDIFGENFQDVRASFTSKFTANAVLFYEAGKLSGRLAYNWRSNFKTSIDAANPGFIGLGDPQQRLDAALNYTPVPLLTLSLEGNNLLRNIDHYRSDRYRDLSSGLRSQARTIQASARFRF
jgi:TonB-dependent receptor